MHQIDVCQPKKKEQEKKKKFKASRFHPATSLAELWLKPAKETPLDVVLNVE